jgi:Glycosyl hydrolase catalytic core
VVATALSRALAAVVALAALLLVGCGGGSKGGSSTLAPAPVPAGLKIGIGEQGIAMFTDKRFAALDIKMARYVTSYDATRVRFERDLADQWLAAARAAGVEPFVTFGHSRVHPGRLPSVSEFRADVRAFRKRYPDVRVYAPWNEINHSSQPTSDAPGRAADYYNVLVQECPGCTVLAGDVLDQAGMGRYLTRYRRALKSTPKIWGLHNYADSNRFRDSGLTELLRTVPGDVWLTETGGIVRFGRSFPEDEQRAARAVSYAITLARKHGRVKRIYLYNWTGSQPTDRFDSGLVGPDGKARPAYERLRAALQG